MVPSLLAWLLRLAAFYHLCTPLAGEWVWTLPGEEGRSVLGCRLHFSGGGRGIGPSLVRSFQWLLGREWGHKVCGEESEGWEKLSSLLTGGLG